MVACAACCADPCDGCRDWIVLGEPVRPVGDGVVLQEAGLTVASGAIGEAARASRPCAAPLRTLTAEGYETEDCGECGPCKDKEAIR
jgi:hypothetical protein